MFYMSERVWNELQDWARIAYETDKNEISGLLIAMPNDSGDWELMMPDIVKQKNTATTTELDGEAVQEWNIATKMKLSKNKKYKNKKYRVVWWHSHHMMGASWSATDDKEIEAGKTKDWSISLLINLKEDYKLRISYWDPVECHIDTELIVMRKKARAFTKAMEDKYQELCEDDRVVYSSNVHQNTIFQRWNPINSPTSELNDYHDATVDLEMLVDNYMNSLLTYKEYQQNMKEFIKSIKDRPYKPISEIRSKNENNAMIQLQLMEDIEDLWEFKDATTRLKLKGKYGGHLWA